MCDSVCELQCEDAPSRACRHLHMLLDTKLDAPGLRRMKMETQTVDDAEGVRPAIPQARNMRCSISNGTCDMAACSFMIAADVYLISTGT